MASQHDECLHDRVHLQLDSTGVATVRLSRPDKMNALDAAMFDGLLAAADRLRSLQGVRAVVLHGEGRAFCAGLDLASIAAMEGDGGGFNDLTSRTHGLANRFQQVAWQWRELAVPVIAAVHGVALGGGLQVALGADLRYVSPDARLSVREIHWGLVPDMAGMALLRDLVRGDLLRELVYSGRMVSAEEAVQLGLATQVCADPLQQAQAVAHDVAARNPDAIRAAKRLLNAVHDADAAAVLQAESTEQAALLGSANQREAVAAGMQKRAPVFVDPE